jgi:regulator of protease activity HflC (stomatin/prohibitin superfamily)
MGFKIVTGKGVLVLPGFQKARTLSLDVNETELDITCVTTQGIPVVVKAVVIYKVGDDCVSISNAARRFLDKAPAEVEQKIKNVFEGHLRSIVGGLTVEQMIRDREALTERTRSHSAEEMQKLGLVIDTLQIKEIDDPTGTSRAWPRPTPPRCRRRRASPRPPPTARPLSRSRPPRRTGSPRRRRSRRAPRRSPSTRRRSSPSSSPSRR